MKYFSILLALMILVACGASNQPINSDAVGRGSGLPHNFEAPSAMEQEVQAALEKHRGSILYPSDIPEMDLSGLTEGEVFEYDSETWDVFRYTYTGDDSNYHYFDLELGDEGEEVYKAVFRTNGIKGEAGPTDGEGEFEAFPVSQTPCKFKLGSCKYTSYDKEYAVHTTFEDGVWTVSRRLGYYGMSYMVTKLIYDKNGMLLYRGAYNSQWHTPEHDRLSRK